MIRAMRHVVATLTAIRFALLARRDLLLEMLALHHQVAVLARSNRRFRPSDRPLWLVLRRLWPQWRDALVLVQPATVDRWYRDRFDRRWWRRSGWPGRPRINSQCRELIGRLTEENRLWGAPRIHGELLKLGIVVSERTVSRYLRGRRRRPSQTWRTFLANHLGQFTCMSHVLSSYAPGDDVVDAFARTCRSTRLSNRLSASRQCARIDWPASVRPRCPGLRFTQDHLRERRNMRRSADRAPPRTGCMQPTHGGHAEGEFVALGLDQLQPLNAGDRCGSPIAIGASIVGTRDLFVWSAMGTSAW
jgi:hypothetical protein